MSRPRLLDLYCGAGGATRGYQEAGFEVIGVDAAHQPNYCGDDFIRMDALIFLKAIVDYPSSGPWFFEAVHASPPCHDHSNVTGRDRKAAGPKGTGWMLAAAIGLLRQAGLPWVVENVETADMGPDVYRIKLCGSSFGLDLRRHRWFASNVALLAPPCAHHWQQPRFRSLDSGRSEGKLATVIGVHGHINYAGEAELRERAMDIDWMTQAELAQAIPPAYTEWIGAQLIEHLRSAA